MTEFLNKINQLDSEIDNQSVHEQVQIVNQMISFTRQKKIMPLAPKKLGFLPDEIEAICFQVAANKKKKVRIINQLLNSVRQFLSIKYGIWSLPNLATAKLIKDYFQIDQALEIMAGNACWAKALTEVGIETIATDSLEWAKTSLTGNNPYMAVKNYDAPKAIKKFATAQLIICSWAPNFTKSDLLAIKAWQKYNPQSHLLFIGEKNGATNSMAFWQEVKFNYSQKLDKINQSFKSYDFINEQIFEIKHEI
ncbi:SAM-dependent methyltransferase [Lactobacillus bombicola]|uniref:SAM-dependent methyltransferase n=1 Tax=Lactobacillus bombicola TaxID=1505723 RepID=A0A396SYH1_9LACO|nr:SAM-dependent methyltransferase [Lactobacillus bombicola]RHW54649.1 SAM-dependent methyltransferase [Lactobacillus bombicola]